MNPNCFHAREVTFRFALLCFALLFSGLLCFAVLCFAVLCLALHRFDLFLRPATKDATVVISWSHAGSTHKLRGTVHIRCCEPCTGYAALYASDATGHAQAMQHCTHQMLRAMQHRYLLRSLSGSACRPRCRRLTSYLDSIRRLRRIHLGRVGGCPS